MTTATKTRPTLVEVATTIGIPVEKWAHECHSISLAVVKSGLFPVARVARGWCRGVPSQHSWVVLGRDCYADHADILDPTLWSYDPAVKGLWWGQNLERHEPHGYGDIWSLGKPAPDHGPKIPLAVEVGKKAREFLYLIDRDGLTYRQWCTLAGSLVGGWPAAEILAAMDDTPDLSSALQIDRLGMLTDRNPGGLYLPEGGLPAPGEDPERWRVDCLECGYRDIYDEYPGDGDDNAECDNCASRGADDTFITTINRVFPCPAGVAAWADGCDDDNHEPRTGLHVIEIDR